MTVARLYVDEKKEKKNGTVAVYCLVHIDNKTIKINTGVYVTLDNFDKAKGRVKDSDKDAADSNLIIDVCLSRINEIFVRYRLQSRILTADLLQREYRNPTVFLDFYNFLDKQIIDRVKNKELSAVSAKHHRVLLNKLKEFKKTLNFAEIDLKLITNFRNWCRVTKKNDVNTVHKMLSYWQTYMNIARREEIITTNPFDNFSFKRIDPLRVYLTEAELRKLVELYDKQTAPDHLQRTLRHFLFMCLTGIRISDFMRLKKDNIQEDTLKFVPHKTQNRKRQELHIPLVTMAKRLIIDENSDSTFVFQPISEQKINEQLKVVAPLAGVRKGIKNHSARHTFATIFLEKTSDVATLQRLLGHSNIRETMLYVHISNTKINSQMENFDSLLFPSMKVISPKDQEIADLKAQIEELQKLLGL
jgi:integrase/recombinase XerD